MLKDLPLFYDMKYTVTDGYLTPDAHLFNDQVYQTLNNVITVMNVVVDTSFDTTNVESIVVNGLIAPSKTTAEIAALEPTSAVGTIWFNTDLVPNPKLQVKTATGVIETITSV